MICGNTFKKNSWYVTNWKYSYENADNITKVCNKALIKTGGKGMGHNL